MGQTERPTGGDGEPRLWRLTQVLAATSCVHICQRMWNGVICVCALMRQGWMDGGWQLGQLGKALTSFGEPRRGPYDVQLTNTAPPEGVCRQDAALHHPFLPPGFPPSAPLLRTLPFTITAHATVFTSSLFLSDSLLPSQKIQPLCIFQPLSSLPLFCASPQRPINSADVSW